MTVNGAVGYTATSGHQQPTVCFDASPRYSDRECQAIHGCQVLLNNGFYSNGGINFFKSVAHSETCVTGMVLSITLYFLIPGGRIHTLANHLQQMPDCGWNCESFNGAKHSSLYTIISVLEGLYAYETMHPEKEMVQTAQARGREFPLRHRLFKSDHTGGVIDLRMTRFLSNQIGTMMFCAVWIISKVCTQRIISE